jgi:hypothetical protein
MATADAGGVIAAASTSQPAVQTLATLVSVFPAPVGQFCQNKAAHDDDAVHLVVGSASPVTPGCLRTRSPTRPAEEPHRCPVRRASHTPAACHTGEFLSTSQMSTTASLSARLWTALRRCPRTQLANPAGRGEPYRCPVRLAAQVIASGRPPCWRVLAKPQAPAAGASVHRSWSASVATPRMSVDTLTGWAKHEARRCSVRLAVQVTAGSSPSRTSSVRFLDVRGSGCYPPTVAP